MTGTCFNVHLYEKKTIMFTDNQVSGLTSQTEHRGEGENILRVAFVFLPFFKITIEIYTYKKKT